MNLGQSSTLKSMPPTMSDISHKFLCVTRQISTMLKLLYGVGQYDCSLNTSIACLQSTMKNETYIHMHDNETHIVIFKTTYFMISQDIMIWKEAIEYGDSLGISTFQLRSCSGLYQTEEAYID